MSSTEEIAPGLYLSKSSPSGWTIKKNERQIDVILTRWQTGGFI